MNDPLKDNRIFPEEMHQKPEEKIEPTINLTWLWTLLIIIGLIVLVWFGYRYYQNSKPNPEPNLEEIVLPNPQAQQQAITQVRDSVPELTREERQQKIDTLFGNN